MQKSLLLIISFVLVNYLNCFAEENISLDIKQENYPMNSIANLENEGNPNLLTQELSYNSEDKSTINNESPIFTTFNIKEIIPESIKFWQIGYSYIDYDDGFPDSPPFGLTLHYNGPHKWYQGAAVSLEVFKLDSNWLDDLYYPIIDVMWLPGITFVKKDYGAFIYAGGGVSMALIHPMKVGVDFYVKNIGLGISYKLYNPIGKRFNKDLTETANVIWFNLGYVRHSD